MKLNNKELYDLLIEKGIYHLYHANTVSTSKTYIEQNGLMSRGAIEQKGLSQTTQSSDDIDKKFDVWNDVFLDTTDLHRYFSTYNYYGPVAFKISIDFLLESNFEIWITKNNPIYWNSSTSSENKYFSNVDELKNDWDNYYRQRKMVTIKNILDPILFDKLVEVIVDDPRIQFGGKNYCEVSISNIKESLKLNKTLKGKFKLRADEDCVNCRCRKKYLNEVSIPELNRLFL
jgi:hypothetical protein